MEQLADDGACNVIFRQASHPKIDVVDVCVRGSKTVLNVHVARDCGEARARGQADGLTAVVVALHSVIATALNVERTEVETSAAWRTEEEIAQTVDNERIDLLCALGRQATQDRLDATLKDEPVGREERLRQRQVPLGDGAPVVFETQQHVGNHAVAETVGRRRKRVVDSGIHVGLITLVRSHGAGPEEQRQELLKGDDLDLGPHDGTRHLIELLPIPVRCLTL